MLTLTELRRRYYLPKPYKEWRTIQRPVHGKIVALPHFIGFAVATNGIIVALETTGGAVLFGHLQWFEPDHEDELEQLIPKCPARSKATKSLKVLDEFLPI